MFQEELTQAPVLDVGTGLMLPQGTIIGIQYVEKITGTVKPVTLVKSPDPEDPAEGKVYLAILDEDDVDFEVAIDNSHPQDRDFRWTVELQGKNYSFEQPRGTRGAFTALTANGRKLHFLRQSRHYNEALVGATAIKYNLAYDDEAAKMASRLKFKGLEYSQKQGKLIEIIIKNTSGESTSLLVAPSDTIFSLKLRLHDERAVPPPDQQRLVWQGRLLLDNHSALTEYGIKDQSTLFLSVKQQGGGGYGATDTEMSAQDLHGLLISPESDMTDACEPPTNVIKLEGGTERGVICFGEKSNERMRRGGIFLRDGSICVQPFVIEMRLAPQ